MRYVSSIASSTYRLGGYEVKGTSGGRDAKLNMAREQIVPVGEQNKLHEHQRDADPREWQSGVLEERRKASRRVSRQSLLLDLRSRIDRRRRNLRDGDIVEHIDEEV